MHQYPHAVKTNSAKGAAAAPPLPTPHYLHCLYTLPVTLQGQAPGQLLLCNTAEAMRRIEKPAALQAAGQRLWADILSGAAEAQPQLLLGFLMLAFGDLKHWVFDYW